MLIYLIVIFLLLSCVLHFDIRGRKQRRMFWESLIVVVLILLAGLRNHVGADSISYEYDFYYDTPILTDLFKSTSWLGMREPLWLFLMSFCKTIFGSFISLQFVHAILVNVLLYRFFKKMTDKVFTALLITFLTLWIGFNFEILRQSLCIAIFLNALLLLRDLKIARYVFFSIVMFGIQNFSIVMAVAAPLVMFANKKWLFPFLVLVSIYVFFFVDETLLNLFFLETERFANDNMQDKIDAYLNKDTYGYASYNINGIIKLFVLSVFFPLSIVFLNKNMVKIDKCSINDREIRLGIQPEDFLNAFVSFYIVIGLLTSKLIIFFRFQQYVLPFVVAAASIVLFKKRRNKIVSICFYVLFSLFMIDSIITLYKPSSLVSSPVSYDTRYFPYRSVFQEEDKLRKSMWDIH